MTITRGSFVAFVVVLAAACTTRYTGIDSAPETTDANVDGGGLTSDAAADAGEPDAGSVLDSGVDAAKCDPAVEKKEESSSEADGLIAVNNAQNFGTLDVANLALGRSAIRFKPSVVAMAAMRDQRVVALSLTLTRADSSTNCGGSCANLREDGTLTAQPLRSDWNEATMSWQLRDNNSGTTSTWGAPGATAASVDVAADTFSVDVLASTLAPTLALDPSKWPQAFLAADRVALITDFHKDGARKQFVTVTREALVLTATPKSPPKLTIRYCP